MRATQVIARGRVEFVDAPEPVLKPGHVLVRPLLLALCGSDLRRIYYASDAEYPWPAGTSGHEMIGEVLAVDAPGTPIRVGDRALVISPIENAMSELYLAAAEDVLVLPPAGRRPLEQLLMGQQLGTVLFAGKVLPNLVGKDVAIIGQGSAGLFFDWLCRCSGAQRVIALDLYPARVALAPRMGATHSVLDSRDDPFAAVAEITDGALADVVICAAGELEAINLAPRLVRVGGRIHFFGVPHAERFEFDFFTFFRRYCQTTSLSGTAYEPGRRSFRQALNLIAAGEIDVAPIISHRLPFAGVLEGYEMARTCADGAVKIVIEMPAYATSSPSSR